MANKLQSKKDKNNFKVASFQGILIVGLIVSITAISIELAYNAYQKRKLLDTLQTLEKEKKQLLAQWSQLLLEQSTWASYARIESKAIEELNMIKPTADSTDIISP